nr:response regulator [Bacteroidota bacterium]
MEKINEAINGGKPFFEWMHRDSEGVLIPCEVRLIRLTFGNKMLIRGSIHDISERKKRERLLRVQFTTAHVLSQSETIEECATRICNSIVKNLEWDFASLWMYDDTDQQLHYSNCWYASTPLINKFGQVSQSFRFSKGVGLPGQVLESGESLWIKDIQSHHNFPRAKHAMDAGLHAAFAFPIQSNEKTAGVFEVFSKEVKAPDEAMLTMFDAIGKLICQFILRKRAELEIRKSNERYKGLLNNIGAGVVIHAPNTSIINCNPKGLELLGLNTEQITGKMAMDQEWKFLDENNNPLPLDKYPVNQIITSQKPLANFIAGINRPVTHDVIWVRVNGFPVLDNSGELIEIVISFIDITESRLAEQELKNSESFLKETQQIAHLGVYILDVENGTWTASEILEDILGIDANYEKTYEGGQEIIQPQWRKMVTDYFTAEVIGNREKFDLQYRIIRPNDKEERWVHCVGDLKWSDDNKPLKLVATVQDITVIKQSEMLLKQKNEELEIAKAKAEESDRLKSAFLANMSHEIRTPMSGILGFADLLKTPGLTGDQQQNYIRIIEKSGARMLNIINDIIDISKIESHLMEVNIQQININEQIEYVYHFFKPEVEAKGMKLYLRNSLATKDSILKTDKEKFFAILTNLVKNAVKFTNTGSIEMGYIIKNNDAKEELQFYVKDTGIGIPKERQGVIFERFVQANIKNKMALQGAGLGLSIAKGYVEMLQGKIWAESEVGIGSTFYFTLPYNKEPKKPTEQNILPAEKTYNRISNLKILLAEDDEIAEMLFDLSAKPFFKNIIKARNGIEAVETCRNNPDIDIVLMDVQMPLMDGHEATRKIREFNKDVVIIAQTAFGLAGDREKALEAGCNTYIAKPFRIIELLELIHDYFN